MEEKVTSVSRSAQEKRKGFSICGEHKWIFCPETGAFRGHGNFRERLGVVVPPILQLIGSEEATGVQGLQALADVDPLLKHVLEGLLPEGCHAVGGH